MSGPWADEVAVMSLSRVAEINLGKMLQPAPRGADDFEIPYINAGLIAMDSLSELPRMFGSSDDVARYGVRKGDLVVAEGGDVGRTAFVPELPVAAIIQNSLHRVRARPGADIRFIRYSLDAVYGSGWLDVLCNRATFGHLTQEKLRALPIPARSAKDQARIADRLDEETARIDKLIAAKRRLRDLTKQSLDAAVMQLLFVDNDATWASLGRFVDLLPGNAFPSEAFTTDLSGVKLLRGVNIAPGAIRWDECVYLPQNAAGEFSQFALKLGDIVLGMDRPLIAGGLRVAQVGEHDVPALLVQRVARLRARSDMEQDYVRFALSSQAFAAHFAPIVTGVSVPHISEDQILSFRLPVPRRDVQIGICERLAHIERAVSGLDKLLREQSALLIERRQALITKAIANNIPVWTAA